MRVKDCENCKYKRRKIWSTSYKPMAYHTIGMSHAYAYCDKYKCRVLRVKKCEVTKELDEGVKTF